MIQPLDRFERVDESVLASMSLYFPRFPNAADRSGWLRTAHKGPVWSGLKLAPSREADC
jgi:hypothetical protein